MITAGDLERWVAEAGPALRSGYVHRVWREGEGSAWVLLARHHAGGDPEAKVERRVALELAVAAEEARCLALPPEDVEADDDRAKKAQARDQHPFLVLLRRHLIGARVEDLTAVEGERVALLRLARPAEVEPPGPPALQLAVELFGRVGNLILSGRADDAAPWTCLGSLQAGKAGRSFEPGAPYRLPPARPAAAPAAPEALLAGELAPDPETLRLGRAAAALQRAAGEALRRASRHHQLLKAARQGLGRLEGIVHKLEAQQAEAARADELERLGDLLKANLARVPKGARSVTLTAYDAQGAPVPVEVALEPALSAQEQMKAFYKKARKLRSGEAAVQTRLGETDAKIAEGRRMLERLEAADPEDDPALDALELELVRAGLVPKPKEVKPKLQANQGPRRYQTREGHEVLVGRSDEENDHLTMRVARGNDLFFHVRGCPGSHVILRVDPQRPPNHESLLDAATLAIHFSKARNRPAADVSYTPRKWVKKPRGAKPGLVQISNEKTIRAGGDEERLRRILSSRGEEEQE